MAETETTEAPEATGAQLEGQTYEIIRKRLTSGAEELRKRLDLLNEDRKEVFGSIETLLKETQRVTTENNCVARDLVELGQNFIFGYNVHIGLRTERHLRDVFQVFRFEENEFHEQALDLIGDERFERDFQELYKYYKATQFVKFAIRGPHLFMIFRTGKAVSDIKAFKWAIDGEKLTYVDNRSDHEFRFPSQHEFEWIRTTRDQHRSGEHPHISIDDRVFVETVGGDLTIKIENNTKSGAGIYAEDVDNKDQTLDDGEIYYSIIGNLIALKIRPYQEEEFRYIIYNDKIKEARRIDSMADACVLLPDDHGLIFSNGFYLQSGDWKLFGPQSKNMMFEQRLRASNGEDFLYVFYDRRSGSYALLSYNLISQEVETPTICAGFALFPTGEMVTFQHQDEPQKHHALQIWQTPFVDDDHVPTAQSESLLFKIGNRDLVRGMAECHEVLNLLARDDSYANLYLDVVKQTSGIVDGYFWIAKPEVQNLKEVLGEIRETANGAISEFEKVTRTRRATKDEVARVTRQVKEVIRESYSRRFEQIDDFVKTLADLRTMRGEVISLRDLRYVDTSAIDTMEEEIREISDDVAARSVDFLLLPDALVPYQERVEAQHSQIDALVKVADGKVVQEEVAAAADELEMLIEVVSNLKIDDATQRTAIIDNISTIFSRLNQTRSSLKGKIKELMSVEGTAEFHSQLKLLDQAVVNYLDICDTPQRCEEYLTKVMIQVEEMEGRFAEFDEFVEQLAEKRDEIYNAFEARRLALIEKRNRRATTLMKSAERILKGVKTRIESFESVNEINGYYASDLMIEKVRDIVEQLDELEDSVKVDDIQSRLKTIREDAVRQLKDRQELYVDGQNIIQMGKHKFTVNVQNLDLTTVMRDGELCYHLTGTNFFEEVADESLLSTKHVWDQEVVSESDEVYRSEYLAYLILESLGGEQTPTLAEAHGWDDEQRAGYVQKFMSPRYSEGYTKGVHDHDASLLLKALIELRASSGLLRFSAPARALAGLFWSTWVDTEQKPLLEARLKGFGKISGVFPAATSQAEYIRHLAGLLNEFAAQHGTLDEAYANEAGVYLFHALAEGGEFAISREASEICQAFNAHLELKAYGPEFAASLKHLDKSPLAKSFLAQDWVKAYLADKEQTEATQYILESALLLVEGGYEESRVIHTPLTRDITGMVGTHKCIKSGTYHLHFNEFMTRLAQFAAVEVPAYEGYVHRKHELVDEFREDLRLEEFQPRVLTSFVRNQLIDKVYLPLVGDNFAKQLGSAGESKRTDRMGLLLLISPPGYGKTTLMEYIANRLGIIFMKINGPAIGHQVTSLDPEEAPNASAREEVEKLNLALEMGDNVMIYLDDIQHCNPELLQKFISLCDATRKIEGVYKGQTRTYDLRGRKVCVVMAGNPYTESGEKFQIPDMLANRADTYNLGEIIGDNADSFELSYLENSLTSNPTLNNLATKSSNDVYAFLRMAQTGSQDPVDLEGSYSLDEINEIVSTLTKLIHARDIVLSVNREYIRSAGQADEYRTEPPFKLQGSYRNMNRISEKVSPIMNDEELATLIYSLYENDAQTLTTGAEANLLKFRELIGTLAGEAEERWENIKRTFSQNVRMKGIDTGDKIGQVIAQMTTFSDGLDAIRGAVTKGVQHLIADVGKDEQVEAMVGQLSQLGTGLEAIQETMSSGLGHLQTMGDSGDDTGGLTATFDPQAMQQLTEVISQLQQTSAVRSEEEETERTIHIVNKVPKVVVSIIREQFKLMEGWMQPLVDATKDQRADMVQLDEKLNTVLQHYNQLLDQFDDD